MDRNLELIILFLFLVVITIFTILIISQTVSNDRTIKPKLKNKVKTRRKDYMYYQKNKDLTTSINEQFPNAETKNILHTNNWYSSFLTNTSEIKAFPFSFWGNNIYNNFNKSSGLFVCISTKGNFINEENNKHLNIINFKWLEKGISINDSSNRDNHVFNINYNDKKNSSAIFNFYQGFTFFNVEYKNLTPILEFVNEDFSIYRDNEILLLNSDSPGNSITLEKDKCFNIVMYEKYKEFTKKDIWRFIFDKDINLTKSGNKILINNITNLKIQVIAIKGQVKYNNLVKVNYNFVKNLTDKKYINIHDGFKITESKVTTENKENISLRTEFVTNINKKLYYLYPSHVTSKYKNKFMDDILGKYALKKLKKGNNGYYFEYIVPNNKILKTIPNLTNITEQERNNIKNMVLNLAKEKFKWNENYLYKLSLYIMISDSLNLEKEKNILIKRLSTILIDFIQNETEYKIIYEETPGILMIENIDKKDYINFWGDIIYAFYVLLSYKPNYIDSEDKKEKLFLFLRNIFTLNDKDNFFVNNRLLDFYYCLPYDKNIDSKRKLGNFNNILFCIYASCLLSELLNYPKYEEFKICFNLLLESIRKYYYNNDIIGKRVYNNGLKSIKMKKFAESYKKWSIVTFLIFSHQNKYLKNNIEEITDDEKTIFVDFIKTIFKYSNLNSDKFLKEPILYFWLLVNEKYHFSENMEKFNDYLKTPKDIQLKRERIKEWAKNKKIL